jgi:hypothetical protein
MTLEFYILLSLREGTADEAISSSQVRLLRRPLHVARCTSPVSRRIAPRNDR